MRAEDESNRSWYLVYSKPAQEHVAREQLARQGFEVYLPMLRARRRRAGRYVERLEPMFPRYLFIRLDSISDNWSPIRSTTGVANLVRFGQQPAKVPELLVSALQSRDDENGVQDIPPPSLRAGDRVCIVDGPLRGYEAIFEATSGRERVTVLLQVAGQYARVQISPQQLDSP